MTISGTELSVDDVLAVLSDAKRRKLLASLIADSPPDGATFTVVEPDVDTEIHHVHLPKLTDYGFIVWDKDSNIITKGPNFEAAEELLGFLAEYDEELPTDEIEV